jgi:hypothetical protein
MPQLVLALLFAMAARASDDTAAIERDLATWLISSGPWQLIAHRI